MKTKIFYKYLWVFTVLLGSFLVASCIEDGDETIALESGDASELIIGSWKVQESKLYNPSTELYHSDMPDDSKLSSVYNFKAGNIGELWTNNTVPETFEWSINESGSNLLIEEENYQITSLGTATMVLESMRVVDEEVYTHRYILNRVADKELAEEDDDATQIVSSDESSTFKRGGYTIVVPKGAVPHNNSGEVGRVAFSFQFTDDLPVGLPYGCTLIGRGNIKIEPMNFIFNSPLTIKIPLNGASAYNIGVYRYDGHTSGWKQIPISKINSDGTVSVSVIELGHFIIVKYTEEEMKTGGLHIAKRYINNGYYYYLTLSPQNSSSSSRSIAFSSNGEDLYMAGVPTGAYTATITRERRSTANSVSSQIETANLGTVKVTRTLTKGSGGYSTYDGWTEISLANVSWSNGRPNDWGEVTKTYGTGKFQATLTWVNVSDNKTDYDLHLTTPNGEVFFQSKRIGAFELDRDWISDLGNAVENIYSINDDFSPGNYKVRVHHYSGATGKRYNCRIIINNMVVKSVTNVLNNGYDDIYSFTIE